MSGVSTEADVKIILSADDQASGPIDSATKQINDSYKQLTNNSRTASRAWIDNNFQLYELGQTMVSLHKITSVGVSAWNAYNLIQIKNEQITNRLADAQERLAQAYASGDPSRIAQEKANEQQVQTDAQKQKLSDTIAAATVAANVITAGGTIATKVIPRALGLNAAIVEKDIQSKISSALNAADKGGFGGGTLESGAARTLGRFARFGGRFAGPAGAIASGLSLLGEQQAGETSIPTGIGALQQIGGDIQRTISPTINIIVQDAGAAAKQVQNELSKVLSFGGQPAS